MYHFFHTKYIICLGYKGALASIIFYDALGANCLLFVTTFSINQLLTYILSFFLLVPTIVILSIIDTNTIFTTINNITSKIIAIAIILLMYVLLYVHSFP